MPVAKTRIASEVAMFPSPTASCSVKLFGRSAVTTPVTETVRPLERREVRRALDLRRSCVARGTVVNEKTAVRRHRVRRIVGVDVA